MQCPSCNANVGAAAKFCEECGQGLPRLCATCGHSISAEAKFCAECGTAVGGAGKSTIPTHRPNQPASPSAAPAERRQLTVMFCDMVGSSALSTQLDPEDQRDVVSAFQGCCSDEVKRFGGMVAQYLGDGVLAYFGYPAAHEDDAERAVRAALALIPAIASLLPASGVRLQSRIGIASGIVVVGDLVREGVTQENAAIGETTNLAARLQSIADPNAILIGPETYRLVGRLFEYHDLGAQRLKGFGEPIRVRQVIGTSGIENRFELRRAAVDTPLLGRDEELDLLCRRWEQAKRGEGRVVLVTGEPGIGKSRLTRALQKRLSSELHVPLLYHCSPYHQDSALYPVIAQLLREAGIERDDIAETKINKLEVLLTSSSENLADGVPLLAALLSIPADDRYPLPTLVPQRLKDRTLELLLAHLKKRAMRQPVLMVVEDMHWIDPTSLELLSLAIDQIKSARILMLATARPEFAPPWPSHRHTSSIGLTRLDKIEGEALVAGVTGAKSLPRELLDQILAHTDGIPLFIEELTKTVLESGLLSDAEDRYELTGPLPPLAIPSTLHASLLARLDRLASAKDVAQIGAAIGREFSYALIGAVAALPESDLNAALVQLVNAELIFQRGFPPDATYQFKHALVQDAAYASLVRNRRQQLHGLIGHTLEQQFLSTADIEPEIVAHHYAEAGLVDRAINYWQKAAERATGTSAYLEAVKHLSNGIALLQKLPSTKMRQRQELEFQIALGGACIASAGWGAHETGAAYARAHELSRLTEDVSHLPKILAGRFVYYHVRDDVDQSQSAANQLLVFARGRRDATAEAMAHRALGDSLVHVGDLRGANAHLEEALRLLGPQSPPLIVGEDVRTAALVFHSLCLALQGNVLASEERLQEAIERARSLDHAFTVVFALGNGCRIKCHLRDHKGLVTNIDHLRAFAEEHNLKFAQQRLTQYHAWSLLLEGRIEDGAPLLRESIEVDKATGALKNTPFNGAMLATAYQRASRFEDGLTLIKTLIEMVNRSGNRYVEAELYRVNAELLVSSARFAEAEEALHRALAIAREQQARIYEIRVATTLARIWRDEGRLSKARDLLAPICDWFGEAQLADLNDANILLNQLKA